MVLMTVDDAVNDKERAQQVLDYYGGHPAVLGWILGNEININLYYGVADSVIDAVQKMQASAELLKVHNLNTKV